MLNRALLWVCTSHEQVKTDILTQTYYMQTKRKFLIKEERDKIQLLLNERVLEEGKSLADYELQAGDVLMYTFTGKLVGM